MTQHLLSISKRSVAYTIAIAAFALCACESKDNNTSSNSQMDEEQFGGIADLIGDSISGVKVSKECAVICYQIDQITNQISAVNSPSALIRAKQEYEDNIGKTAEGITELEQSEQSIANEHKTEADAAYKSVCRSYEVPASGVLANLTNLIQCIDEVKTKDEFMRFEDCRIGMLSDLDHIHLCVESNSHKIPEVKRLAQTLKGKYEAKKKQFGMK